MEELYGDLMADPSMARAYNEDGNSEREAVDEEPREPSLSPEEREILRQRALDRQKEQRRERRENKLLSTNQALLLNIQGLKEGFEQSAV